MKVFTRVTLLFMLVITLNCAILLGLLYASGTFDRMHESALNNLAEVTRNRWLMLQNKMNGWMNINSIGDELDAIVDQTLRETGKTYENIRDDTKLNALLVSRCAQTLVTHLYTDSATGVFLVLDGMGVPDDAQSYAGVYLRDTDPSTHPSTNSDLHMLRGLPPLSRELNTTLDYYWDASFHFSGGAENPKNNFFYQPLEAYRKNGGEARYSSYWSECFTMDERDSTPIITYSLPLVTSEGKPYGVLGVELESAYIISLLNNGDYSERNSVNSYYLGITEDGGATYRSVLSTGALFRQSFDEQADVVAETSTRNGADTFLTVRSTKTGKTLVGAVYPLTLYSRNTVFYDQRWTLVGLREENGLFQMEKDFSRAIGVLFAVELLLVMLIAPISAHSIVKPILDLVRQMHGVEHANAQPLRHTGIAEVDVLADTFNSLNRTVAEEASRISTIITLSGMPIGAFEQRNDQMEVFCSDGFFSLLGCEKLYNASNRLSVERFRSIMEERLDKTPIDGEDVYLVQGIAETRYLRLTMLCDQRGTIGTLMDVSDEIENRHRIEHDRDYDLLTNIFNRRAFEARVDELFAQPGKVLLHPVAALMMVDLDNLKSLNDSYGHDSGDLYIRTFAKGLDHLAGQRCLVARRSGDEFYLFYYGWESKEEIRLMIRTGWEKLISESLLLPDGTRYKVRASAGIAWYPQDSEEFVQLVHYADFAMYCAKNTAKGSIKEFCRSDYGEAGYLFNGSRALDRLLDDRLVRYMLQPIVSAADGGVMGYELLMRPMVEELISPLALLNLAKRQGKLYHVERLTWNMALDTAQRLEREGKLAPDVRLFINSIANQLLSEEDESVVFQLYGELYHRLVVEITEEEQNNEQHTANKLLRIKRFGGQVAIDDFG
ncbi:MAG: diguanylate cyclase, partial [Clostridia bacterium]